jgi:hypothetical protein
MKQDTVPKQEILRTKRSSKTNTAENASVMCELGLDQGGVVIAGRTFGQ